MRPSAKVATLSAAKCLPGVVANATDKEGSMTRSFPNPWLAPTRTARRTYAHARVEGAAITLPFSSSKSARSNPNTSTTARSAEILEGGKMVYLWGFRQKEVYGLILTPYRGRPRK
jgi:hypothetical protein